MAKALAARNAQIMADRDAGMSWVEIARKHGMKGQRVRQIFVREDYYRKRIPPSPDLPDNTPIEQIALSVRSHFCLLNAGIATVGDVRRIADSTLLRLPNFGRKSFNELRMYWPYHG